MTGALEALAMAARAGRTGQRAGVAVVASEQEWL
jgi:hypothetical protein